MTVVKQQTLFANYNQMHAVMRLTESLLSVSMLTPFSLNPHQGKNVGM